MAGIITRAATELVAIVKVISIPNADTVRKLEKASIEKPAMRVTAFMSIARPAVRDALLLALSRELPILSSDLTLSMKCIE